MTDQEVKALVRQRDGYKCARCGMTNEEHEKQHGRVLDVHRAIPGIIYEPFWCVTLCQACHGKMPKRVEDVVLIKGGDEEKVGVAFIALFLHHVTHLQLLQRLREIADAKGTGDWEAVARQILWNACADYDDSYCI